MYHSLQWLRALTSRFSRRATRRGGRSSTGRSARHSPRRPTLPSPSFCDADSISPPKLPGSFALSSGPMAPLDPELDVASKALVDQRADFVVVGGFAVIANRFVRATEDIDFLVPDDPDNDRRVLAALRSLDGRRLRDGAPLSDEHLLGRAHLRAATEAGIIDVLRGGLPPLDFETVRSRAIPADYGGVRIWLAGLRSIVGFKRLAGRPRDRNDLLGLAEIHGELPIDPIPGLDDV
jgi:hypothetical protein